MTLVASGTIGLGGSLTNASVNIELGQAATALISMNDTNARTLAGVSSGAISLASFYGKSNFTPTTVSFIGTGSSTYTVPSGASNVIIEIFGAGGKGGDGVFDGTDYWGGGGSGGGAYSRSS